MKCGHLKKQSIHIVLYFEGLLPICKTSMLCKDLLDVDHKIDFEIHFFLQELQ